MPIDLLILSVWVVTKHSILYLVNLPAATIFNLMGHFKGVCALPRIVERILWSNLWRFYPRVEN